MLLLALAAGGASADDLASPAEARALADRAVALLQQEKLDDAYGAVKPYWPVNVAELDGALADTHAQWPVVRANFGSPLAAEFVREVRAGSSLVRYVYLQKFERHAIVWLFTFYRPADRWILSSLSFSDDLEAMLSSP
jgi:hypothetical protein